VLAAVASARSRRSATGSPSSPAASWRLVLWLMFSASPMYSRTKTGSAPTATAASPRSTSLWWCLPVRVILTACSCSYPGRHRQDGQRHTRAGHRLHPGDRHLIGIAITGTSQPGTKPRPALIVAQALSQVCCSSCTAVGSSQPSPIAPLPGSPRDRDQGLAFEGDRAAAPPEESTHRSTRGRQPRSDDQVLGRSAAGAGPGDIARRVGATSALDLFTARRGAQAFKQEAWRSPRSTRRATQNVRPLLHRDRLAPRRPRALAVAVGALNELPAARYFTETFCVASRLSSPQRERIDAVRDAIEDRYRGTPSTRSSSPASWRRPTGSTRRPASDAT